MLVYACGCVWMCVDVCGCVYHGVYVCLVRCVVLGVLFIRSPILMNMLDRRGQSV